ncbi:MAG TPA: DNA recombination protein RmuC, partial [Candidatus Deferrimicrobium sp.]|nr:DNA recombination protein RmuC [Candidatus Deferrimicrobium sp.]
MFVVPPSTLFPCEGCFRREGGNYVRQTVQNTGNRPDFTFLLPNSLVLNMDVKFPVDNYLKAINAEATSDVKQHTDSFVRDVRARIKEITTRDYIDEEHGTVSCVLLFVPIKSVFAFAQENDPNLIDYALQQRVVLCSPSTLFAVLAIIRQAVDTFTVKQRSKEMLAILGAFRKQWKAFVDEFDKLGKHLDQAKDNYAALMST